jgi:hypothetical protein
MSIYGHIGDLSRGFLARVVSGGICFAIGFGFLTAAAVSSRAQVPQVTVVAHNVVDGLRALAAHPHGSYQVLLWRAHRFLHEHFKDPKFEAVLAELDAGGAKRIQEWGERENSQIHVVRYFLKSEVIKSHDGRSHDFIVEVSHYRGARDFTTLEPSILVKFGFPFSQAAAKRDYPHGTVLDRVFGIQGLISFAKETPRLESIEVQYREIGSASTPGMGEGFYITVELTDPAGHGKWISQSAGYMVCSGLEPLGSFWQQLKPLDLHVAEDTLIPGASFGDSDEKGYPDTFTSMGSTLTPRHSSTNP